MNKKRIPCKKILPIAVTAILTILKPSGLAMVFAIPYFFIESRLKKVSFKDMGFRAQSILSDVKRFWWLLIAPMISGILAISMSKYIVPDFYMHVVERVKPILALDKAFLLIPQLLILAFAEEITFRAFLQTKLSNIMKPIWPIVITSLIFAVGHYSFGSISIVVYDLMFIFIDSIIYGVLYQKTKNVYISTLSHLLANVVGIYILLII